MKNVAVIFGGRSTEHDVSIITGLVGVLAPLQVIDGYNPVPIYIAKDGSWYSEPDLANIHFYSSGDLNQKLNRFKKVALQFDDGLWLAKLGLGGKRTKIDLVFPAMHGTFGEDGSLMGLCRMAGVPFVGSEMAESAIAMDKYLSRMMANAAGINNPKFEWFKSYEFNTNKSEVLSRLSKLKFPLFVKPTHLGSSIAVARVANQTELENAIEVVLHYDDAVIVEEAVENLVEVTVPIMGNDKYELGMVEEILSKGDHFFDFETKYMHGGKKGGKQPGVAGQGGSKYSRMPAKLSKDLYSECESTAIKVFKSLGASGYARIDLLIDTKAKKVYFNEINPLPGTLQRHNWKEAGVSPVELVKKLIKLAFERQAQIEKRQTTFDSSFLQQF